MAGGGNKQHHKELEEELAQWVLSHQNVKKVTQTEICKQALAIYRRIYEGVENKKEFNASKGWLYRSDSSNHVSSVLVDLFPFLFVDFCRETTSLGPT